MGSIFEFDGTWLLRDADEQFELTMSLPGDVHTALEKAGIIEDPYFGSNEYDVRWVSERDWILLRNFELAKLPTRATLILDQVDTVAEIRVNGVKVISTDNAFRLWHADVIEHLRIGSNSIELTLKSPVNAASQRNAELSYPIPCVEWICPIRHGNMLRKPQCDFGWDWNIALAPMGIYGSCKIVGDSGAIGPVMVRQIHSGSAVKVCVEVPVLGVEGADFPVSIEVGGTIAAGTVAQDVAIASVEIINPDLWWPKDHGNQTTYDMILTVGPHVHTDKIALRTVDLINEKDDNGMSFSVRVNGVDIWAKGSCWVPADALPGRITPEKTHALLESAAAANMNMIRVWGGGRYEPDSFYRSCDALGLMVWQDFMFACNLYPCDNVFLDNVRKEVDFQTRRLNHRVTVWCGDNELVGAIDWFKESKADPRRYLVAYDRLNRTIEETMKALQPDADWWPSSPSKGPLDFSDAFHEDGAGDMHFWAVWHEGREFSHYRKINPRFMSEFGFQSYPSMPVIESFTSEVDRNIGSAVMGAHQKDPGGNSRITRTLFDYFRFPNEFEDFVWLSQVQQALAIRMGVSYWRSTKPTCMGSLIWQLNDTWPVASWASLNHDGSWKLMHYAARRFYASVTCVAYPEETGAISIFGINDLATSEGIIVELFNVLPDGSATKVFCENCDLAPLSVKCFLKGVDLPSQGFLVMRTRTADGQDAREVITPEEFVNADLVDPEITISVDSVGIDGRYPITVSSNALSVFTTLEADLPGTFSDNMTVIWPDAPAEIFFTPADAALGKPRFSAKDLWQSTYPQGSKPCQ